jgi:carbon-monoxide dehydrogenase medium subunit
MTLWKTYHLPETLDEALGLLATHGPAARVIAGGTDLILELERGIRRAEAVIDVTRIAGLDEIHLGADGLIHLGPLITHNQVVASELLVQRAFPLAQACWTVGSPQIRNTGTVAGNLITASPANNTIVALRALDARLTLRSQRGTRALSLADFYTGVRQTAMAPDEMLVDIHFAPLASRERGCYLKLGLRRAQAIAVVHVAAVLQFAADGVTVEGARIALGSVAPTIVRAPQAEYTLVGKPLTEAQITEAARLAVDASRPVDDIRGSAAYRRQMVRVFTARALRRLRDGTERADWPADPPLLWSRDSRQLTVGRFSGAVETVVNGRHYTLHDAAGKTLLQLLRDNVGLTGTKEGCAEGECGACTVLLDGKAVVACLVPAAQAHGREIVTVEGLAHTDELHPVQQAFIREGAVQCGYCTPGFVMSGAALLAEKPQPTIEQARWAIIGNLCRCTGYYKILSALTAGSPLDEPTEAG